MGYDGGINKTKGNLMNADRNMITYLSKIQDKIDNGETIKRRESEITDSTDENEIEIAAIVNSQGLNYCEECDMDITWMTQEGHIIFKNGEDIIVAICCEGYYQLDIDYKG